MLSAFCHRYIFFFLSLWMLTSCIQEKIEQGADLVVGDPIPALNLLLSDGSIVNESRLRDKVTVILLFTTECPDCRRQLPVFDRFYREYRHHPQVVVFGISRANSPAVVREYWEQENLVIPYSAQDDTAIYNLFATHTVPRIYISDRSGMIRFIYVDKPLATLEELRERVTFLLE